MCRHTRVPADRISYLEAAFQHPAIKLTESRQRSLTHLILPYWWSTPRPALRYSQNSQRLTEWGAEDTHHLPLEIAPHWQQRYHLHIPGSLHVLSSSVNRGLAELPSTATSRQCFQAKEGPLLQAAVGEPPAGLCSCMAAQSPPWQCCVIRAYSMPHLENSGYPRGSHWLPLELNSANAAKVHLLGSMGNDSTGQHREHVSSQMGFLYHRSSRQHGGFF